MTAPATIAEALERLGARGEGAARTVVTRGAAGTLIALDYTDPDGRSTASGLWLADGECRALGRPVPRSSSAERASLSGPTSLLVDLVAAASASYTERMIALDERLGGGASAASTLTLAELERLHREVVDLRRRVARLASLAVQLGGSLGSSFPGIGAATAEIEAIANRATSFSLEIEATWRDLVLLRNANESNRIARAANDLAGTSNRIAALSNNSNLRMLGLTYLALVLAVIGAVVLIPNTAATILGMPSAAWVPGLWVDLILVVCAAIPIAIVFTRPWVVKMLRGVHGFERVGQEGIAGLPELSPDPAARPTGEPLPPGGR